MDNLGISVDKLWIKGPIGCITLWISWGYPVDNLWITSGGWGGPKRVQQEKWRRWAPVGDIGKKVGPIGHESTKCGPDSEAGGVSRPFGPPSGAIYRIFAGLSEKYT